MYIWNNKLNTIYISTMTAGMKK